MALSKDITTSFVIVDAKTGNKINFTKYFLRALEYKQPNVGVLGVLQRSIPVNPAYVNQNKEITINRMVRVLDASKSIEVENTDGSVIATMPNARVPKIRVGATMKPRIDADSVLIDNFDANNLELFANHVGAEYNNFNVSFYQQRIKDFYDKITADAKSYKLYDHATSQKEADRSSQPAQANSKNTSTAVADIKKGIRYLHSITDFDGAGNGIKLLDAALDYFYHIGSNRSEETSFPFAVNGYDMNDLIIIASRKFRNALSSSEATKFVPGDKRTNLAPGFDSYDGVDIMVDKNLPEGTELVVAVRDSVGYIEPNNVIQVAGEFQKGGFAKMVDPDDASKSTVEKIMPWQGVLYFVKNYYMEILRSGQNIIIRSANS